MDFINPMKGYLKKEQNVISSLNMDEINKAIQAIYDAWQRGSVIYTMGNGGSGATASHMVCDFNKGVSVETGRKFKMICLNDNIPIMLAIANDISYDQVFQMQMKDVVKEGDLLIAFSGSGNSQNIINAVNYAKAQGALIVAMTGYDGGKLMKLADYNLHVPCKDMQITEDLHMVFVHTIMRLFNTIGDEE